MRRHRELVEAEAETPCVEDKSNDPVKGIGRGGRDADASPLLRLHVTFSRGAMIISWGKKTSQNFDGIAKVSGYFPENLQNDRRID